MATLIKELATKASELVPDMRVQHGRTVYTEVKWAMTRRLGFAAAKASAQFIIDRMRSIPQVGARLRRVEEAQRAMFGPEGLAAIPYSRRHSED